ncbi:hypothetical protein SBRCBS47491_009257 [Sporothrix bragantina]|uniref:Telomeric single stranded DNA binding POT1/Cdc13 domain-containing protein n=1 Tax=Sporothrix bragantina TaxID=671064 RepID=A0ABP0CTA9_9PEZI
MSAANGGERDGDGSAVAAFLAGAALIPIAQLNPDLSASSNDTPRAVRGEVTIVWPYNSVQRSLAFLLAEPDVRLRRSKGQIRVQLYGASASAVADSGLGGGDEVLLSLAGAGWAKDESSLKLPGSRVEWQLEFKGRLVLQAKVGEAQETHVVDVDRLETEDDETNTVGPAANGNGSTFDVQVPPSSPPIGDLFRLPASPAPARMLNLNNDEYASPAFIKRARISFGSLFEPGFDIFEEDGGVRGRGRKRTRFGRPSNAWRYSSQSVSPERKPEQEPEPEPEPEPEEPDTEREKTPTALADTQKEDEATVTASSPPVPLEAATPTPTSRPQTEIVAAEPVAAAESSAPPALPTLPTPQVQLSATLQQESTQATATEVVVGSTSLEVSVSSPVPEVQMGGIPNPFAPASRPTSNLFGSAAPLSSGSNPFAAIAPAAAANPFSAHVPASSTGNPFAASSAVPFGAPGADSMGFVPDANLFNDHVRFSFGDPANAFDQHQNLDPALQDAAPPAEGHFTEAHTQYQYPEPPTQHDTPHAEPHEPSRSIGQDHMMVWPIDAPTLDAQHAEGVISADTLVPESHSHSHPAETEANEAQRRAAASFIASGANDGVFEDDSTNVDEATDLPREVDNFGYNDRRYQNEEEEQEVGMEDADEEGEELPSSRRSDEEDDDGDLASDGPEEAEPKDHLLEGDEDENDEDAEGEDDELVEVVGEEEDESDEDADEEEPTDQPGDDYDMRNYENVDDDMEGDEVNQSGAVTFDGEGEEGEEDEEIEEEEEGYDDDEDADAEADDDHYAAAPQQRLLASHGQEHGEDDDGGSEGEDYDEDEEGEGEEEEEAEDMEEEEEEEEGHYDEEEEYDEDEEDEELEHQPAMYRAPARPQPSQPVVIDLLSDSDDDDAPSAPPPHISQTPVPPPVVPAASSSPPEIPTEEATEESGEEEGEEEEEKEEEEGEEDGEGEEEEEEGEYDEDKEDEEDEDEEGGDGGQEAVAKVEEPQEQPEPEQPDDEAKPEAEPEAEEEDELEQELEAELEAELAADDEKAEESKEAGEPKEAAEAIDVDEAEAETELPTDAERVESVVTEEAKEAEDDVSEQPIVEQSQSQPEETEQAAAESPVTGEAAPPLSLDETAEEANIATETVKDNATDEPVVGAVVEEVVLEKPIVEEPVIEEPVVEKPVAEELVIDIPTSNEQTQQEEPQVDSEDVAMAEAEHETEQEANAVPEVHEVVDEDVIEAPVLAELPQVPETPQDSEKTEPPKRTVRTRSQSNQQAQESAAAASSTPFSPPATQEAAGVAASEPPQQPAAPPTQAQLPTPMQTQDMTSFTDDADIDNQIQSQLMSEMAMSFEFDRHPDIDMHSVASAAEQHPPAADVDMADGDNEDEQMVDEEQPSAIDEHQEHHEHHGESMDVDAGTDIDMQSVVSEQLTVVIEEVVTEEARVEVDTVVTEPAPVDNEDEDKASGVVVAPTGGEEEADAPTLHKNANEEEEADSSSSQQQEEQQKTEHLQVKPEEQPPTATSASPPAESRHKMSLRSTNSRLRRSLSPQPVDINAKIAAANAALAAGSAALAAAVAEPAPAPSNEPDTSVQIARSATNRRSKRARAASQSTQDEAVPTTEASQGTQEATQEDVGEDVSVLMARAAASKRRASRGKEKEEKEKEVQKEKEKRERKELDLATASPPASMAEVKLALDRCRDTVPDCMPLRNLRPHLKTLLDVAVIATSSSDDDPPQRTRTRQYAMSLTVTDPSLVEHVSASRHHLHNMHPGGSRRTSPAVSLQTSQHNNNDAASDTGSVSLGLDIDALVEVSLYRAHKETLPTFHAGDGLLLRRFEVVALPDKGFGLRSTDESAYAVFPSTIEGETSGENSKDLTAIDGSPQVNGPPVEDITREAQYIGLLKQWYRLLDDGARAQLAAANARFAAVDMAARGVKGD